MLPEISEIPGRLTLQYGSHALCQDVPCRLRVVKADYISWSLSDVPAQMDIQALMNIMQERDARVVVSFRPNTDHAPLRGAGFLNKVTKAGYVGLIGVGELQGYQPTATPA